MGRAMTKVFLGGTCNGSTWRDRIIPLLEIDYYNPVVNEWDGKSCERELEEREKCDYCLYALTPLMEGAYSVAELVDDSNKRPEKTIFVWLERDGDAAFSAHQKKAMEKIAAMVKRNGAHCFETIEAAAAFLNAR